MSSSGSAGGHDAHLCIHQPLEILFHFRIFLLNSSSQFGHMTTLAEQEIWFTLDDGTVLQRTNYMFKTLQWSHVTNLTCNSG